MSEIVQTSSDDWSCKKKELNKDREEFRETKIFQVYDAAELGFPGGQTIIRTYRRTQKTKSIKTKDGTTMRCADGKPTQEVVYHVSSLDTKSRTAEQFAKLVRTHWSVEVYHGKRDNGYHEDVFARRCGEKLLSSMMVARSFGLWICAHLSKEKYQTTEEVKERLNRQPRMVVRFATKGGLL